MTDAECYRSLKIENNLLPHPNVIDLGRAHGVPAATLECDLQ